MIALSLAPAVWAWSVLRKLGWCCSAYNARVNDPEFKGRMRTPSRLASSPYGVSYNSIITPQVLLLLKNIPGLSEQQRDSILPLDDIRDKGDYKRVTLLRVYNISRIVAIAAVSCTSLAFAQSITGLPPTEPESIQNQIDLSGRHAAYRAQSSKSAMTPHVVVFTGDTVISQFVDGGSWLTSITVTNLETHSTSFDVLFFQDDGTDFNVPIVGLTGLSRAVTVTLAPMGTLTFSTAGISPGLTTGWALLSQTNSDSVGISAVFRQTVPGRQSQEAVVPAVNQFETHFVLSFDDTAYITGLALANPTLNTVGVIANIRASNGTIIDTQNFTLPPYNHLSFSLPANWASTRGISGTIEFLTSGFGVGALGLRFNGAAFTSLNVLENFNWVAP
jgi:hypothetical protein